MYVARIVYTQSSVNCIIVTDWLRKTKFLRKEEHFILYKKTAKVLTRLPHYIVQFIDPDVIILLSCVPCTCKLALGWGGGWGVKGWVRGIGKSVGNVQKSTTFGNLMEINQHLSRKYMMLTNIIRIMIRAMFS